jgi:hypothetical protein
MKTIIQVAVGFGLVVVLLVLAGMSMSRPATADSLPPRPSLTPNPSPVSPSSKDQGGDLLHGSIELNVPGSTTTLWTVVQWQDTLGDWYPVEGWQGTLDEVDAAGVGSKIWWVGQNEMGQKFFRWLVYEGEGGRLLATSRSFDLPCYNGEVIQVEVTLPD